MHSSFAAQGHIDLLVGGETTQAFATPLTFRLAFATLAQANILHMAPAGVQGKINRPSPERD